MLKIDRSFVMGLGESVEDTAIVEHVIGMAKALGMVTVGEGIETPRQLAELHWLGCELAQGYLLSHPVGPEEIDAILSRGGGLARPRGGRPVGRTLSGELASATASNGGLFGRPDDDPIPGPRRAQPAPPVPVRTGAPSVAAD